MRLMKQGGNDLIRLEEMSTNEFQQYLRSAIEVYAAEHVRAGNWEESESIGRAAQEYERLLPEGEKTINNKLFIIRDGEQEVGMIWLAKRTADKGFIFDINIKEEHQGRGYGKAAMLEIEGIAHKLGLTSIKLHVFGHNRTARALYEKIGYIETDIVMEKRI